MKASFEFKLVGTHKTSLERQIKEALLIEHTPNENLMNSKAEWGFNAIPRVRIALENDPGNPINDPQTHRQANQPTPELNAKKRPMNNNCFSQISPSGKRSRVEVGQAESQAAGGQQHPGAGGQQSNARVREQARSLKEWLARSMGEKSWSPSERAMGGIRTGMPVQNGVEH